MSKSKFVVIIEVVEKLPVSIVTRDRPSTSNGIVAGSPITLDSACEAHELGSNMAGVH